MGQAGQAEQQQGGGEVQPRQWALNGGFCPHNHPASHCCTPPSSAARSSGDRGAEAGWRRHSVPAQQHAHAHAHAVPPAVCALQHSHLTLMYPIITATTLGSFLGTSSFLTRRHASCSSRRAGGRQAESAHSSASGGVALAHSMQSTHRNMTCPATEDDTRAHVRSCARQQPPAAPGGSRQLHPPTHTPPGWSCPPWQRARRGSDSLGTPCPTPPPCKCTSSV